MGTTNSKLKDIIEKALMSKDPILQKAFEQEKNLRKRTANELEALCLAQKKAATKTEIEFKRVKEATAQTLQRDAELISKLDTALLSYETGVTAETARYPLKLNKMSIATVGKGIKGHKGAKGMVEEHFPALYAGDAPEGYSFDYHPTAVTLFDGNLNTTNIFGNSKGTFYKTAALTTYLSTIGKTKLTEISLLPTESGPWVERSAMVHHTPIPSTLNLLKLDTRFAQCTYTHNNQFYYVHSGYAFGGGRDGSKNPWAPEDCSSWIAKITGCSIGYSTADQLCLYRFKLKTDIVSPTWYKSPEFNSMQNLYDAVNSVDAVKDPSKIQAGQTAYIYAHRNFDISKDKSKTELGTGGHTGLVLGMCSDAKESSLAVLSYNRDMPGVEGFGVNFFPLFPEPENKKVMLFSLAGSAANMGQTASIVATTATAGAATTATTTAASNNPRKK